VRLPHFWATWDGAARQVVTGEIVHIDGFGNLVTNIPRRLFAAVAPERLTGATVTGAGYACRGLVGTDGAARAGALSPSSAAAICWSSRELAGGRIAPVAR